MEVPNERKGRAKNKGLLLLEEAKYYKDNFGYYYSKGLLTPAKRFLRWLYIFVILFGQMPCHLNALAIMFYQDFSEFTELFHFLFVVLLAMLGEMSVVSEHLEKLIRQLDDGLHDYGDTLDRESINEIQKSLKETNERKNFRSKFMIFGLHLASFSIIILRPIYDFIGGKFSRADLLDDNVNRYLPVPLWAPFDVTTWYGQLYTTVVLYYVVIQTTFVVIASSVLYVTSCEEICYQLTVLNLTLRNLKKRALHIGEGELTKEALQGCLKRSIKHHTNIIECFNSFQKLYSIPLWLIVTISTYLICLAAYLITMEELKLSQRITSVLFLVFETIHLLIYCYYGENIQTLSADTFNAIYDWDWTDCSVWIKKESLIIQARSKYPLKLSCGGLMFANLNTFSNVCSSAYSYFNLLKASKS